MSGYVLLPDQSLSASEQGLICEYCHSILRAAVQTRNSGKRLCEDCFKEIVSLPETQRPENIFIEDENDFNIDRAARRAVEQLSVRCEKCPWKGIWRELENHECEEEEFLEITPASRAGGPCAEQDVPIQAARRMFQGTTTMAREQQQLLQAVGELQSQQQNTLSEMAAVSLSAALVRANPQQQPLSTDGKLPWRVMIPEMNVRLQSRPFYTGMTGYKLCVRAVFRAGSSRNELRLSLYFSIMRGEYDSFLKWPFSSKVSFILVDPSNRKHIVKSFHPDSKSSSYLRPVSEMNIPMGFPYFAGVSKDYVRDNSILIKCIVDTSVIIHP